MKSLKQHLAGRSSTSRFAFRHRLWRIVTKIRDDRPLHGYPRELGNLKLLKSSLEYLLRLKASGASEALNRTVRFNGISIQEYRDLLAKQVQRVLRAREREANRGKYAEHYLDSFDAKIARENKPAAFTSKFAAVLAKRKAKP